MSFNKWYPQRAVAIDDKGGMYARRMRLAWWASTLMLGVGYLLMFLYWNA